MWSRPLVLVVALSVALAGCFGGDEKDKKDPMTEAPPPAATTNETENFTVREDPVVINTLPAEVEVGTNIDVIWRVDFGPDGPPRTNETGLAWGLASVEKPLGPESYDNVSGVQTEVDVPIDLTTNITADTPGTLYLRAYATWGTITYFSDEVAVAVNEIEPTIIVVGAQLTGPIADYSPSEVTIPVGGWVQWDSDDAFTHTATTASGAPERFDVRIEANEMSPMIRLDTPGTYTYQCSIHPTMPSASIIVA